MMTREEILMVEVLRINRKHHEAFEFVIDNYYNEVRMLKCPGTMEEYDKDLCIEYNIHGSCKYYKNGKCELGGGVDS